MPAPFHRKAPISIPDGADYRLTWGDLPAEPAQMMRDVPVDGVQVLVAQDLPADQVARQVRKALARTDPKLRRPLRRLIFPGRRLGRCAANPDVIATAGERDTVIVWSEDWRQALERAVFNHELAHLAGDRDHLPSGPWRERWEQARLADQRHAIVNIGAHTTQAVNARKVRVGPLTRTLRPGSLWVTCYAHEQDSDRGRLSEDFAESFGLYLHARSRRGRRALIRVGWRSYRFADLFPFRAAVIEQMLRPQPTWHWKVRWRARRFDLGPLTIRPVCPVRDGEEALMGAWRVWNRATRTRRYLGRPLINDPRDVLPWPGNDRIRALHALADRGRVPLHAAQAVLSDTA